MSSDRVTDGEIQKSEISGFSDSRPVTRDGVTDGESEKSARLSFLDSLAVTSEEKLREREYLWLQRVPWARVREARKAAEFCTLCGVSLVGQPVGHGLVLVEETGCQYRTALCAWCDWCSECCTNWSPCDGCGRPWIIYSPPGKPRLCSQRCRSTYYNRIRNARNAQARNKPCEQCGEEFIATRRDAKHCSDKCRQKAYRARKKKAR